MKTSHRLCMKLFLTRNTTVQRCLYHIFQNRRIHFRLLLLFWKNLSLQVRINKMVNEHAVDYHPSPYELTSRIHPLIFLWNPLGFISLQIISNLYMAPFGESCQTYHVKITRKQLCESKKWIYSFLLLPQMKIFPQILIIIPRQMEKGDYKIAEKWPKLNLWGYFSQVLINPTISAPFPFLVSCLLSLNLDSNMLRCKVSLP